MKSSPNRTNFGFIAQDVLKVLPEIVEEIEWNQETGEKRFAMAITEIFPFAVKAIQEQHAEIAALKEQVASLKALVETLVSSK